MSKTPSLVPPIRAVLVGCKTYRLSRPQPDAHWAAKIPTLDFFRGKPVEVDLETAQHLARQTFELEVESRRGIFEARSHRMFKFENFDPGPLDPKAHTIDRRSPDQRRTDEEAIDPENFV